MDIFHDEYEPVDFMIPIKPDYIPTPNYKNRNYGSNIYDGFDIGDAFYTSGNPELQLPQFRDLTHDIYYYWNGFTEDGQTAVLKKFNNFHPLNGVVYNSLNRWDDIDRYWFIPDSYYDDDYSLSDDGWTRGYALLAYMKAVADKYLKKHYNDACESREKTIAKAIWNMFSANFVAVPVNPHVPLTLPELNNFKNNNNYILRNYTTLHDDEIQNIYRLMQVCHTKKIAKGGLRNNNIQDFLKKVCSDGIAKASANFKKYLLLKKKYLDKKTIKN
jgi:hypothetical protein